MLNEISNVLAVYLDEFMPSMIRRVDVLLSADPEDRIYLCSTSNGDYAIFESDYIDTVVDNLHKQSWPEFNPVVEKDARWVVRRDCPTWGEVDASMDTSVDRELGNQNAFDALVLERGGRQYLVLRRRPDSPTRTSYNPIAYGNVG